MGSSDPAADARAIQRHYPRVYLACHVRHTRQTSTAHRLSSRDAMVLGHLDVDSGMSPSDLARHLGIGSPTLSAFIRRMQQLGYIDRDIDDHDRRRVQLRLTERGEAAVQATAVLDLQRLTDVLAGMPERDRSRAVTGLRLLAQACSATCTRAPR